MDPRSNLSARVSSPPPPALSHAAEHDQFLRQLLKSMQALRGGDFTVRLPSDMTGLQGKIADAFNEVLAVSERRAGETKRVCLIVGKEGKLKQRMSVPGIFGGW